MASPRIPHQPAEPTVTGVLSKNTRVTARKGENGMDKEKIPVYVDPEMKQEIDIAVSFLGSKSRSDFCREAIAFYLGYLNQSKSVNYLSPLLVSVMKSEIRSSTKFICETLFKLAVEQGIVSNLLAAGYGYSEETVEQLRDYCAREVAQTNGIITAEAATRFQNGDE